MSNRLILLFLSILFLQGMDAQELVVNSFRLDPLKDYASGANAKLDLNKKPLALILVRFAAAAPTFDGNIMGAVEEKEKNEYWVYMAAGSVRLTIHQELALPLEVSFADYGIDRLQSSATYIMDLKLTQADNNYWDNSNTKILGKWTRVNSYYEPNVGDLNTYVNTIAFIPLFEIPNAKISNRDKTLNIEVQTLDFKKNGIVKYNYVHQLTHQTFNAKYKAVMTGSYSIANDSVFINFNTSDDDEAFSLTRKDGGLATQEVIDIVKSKMSEKHKYSNHGLYRKVKLILLDKREMIFEMGNNHIASEIKQEKYIRK